MASVFFGGCSKQAATVSAPTTGTPAPTPNAGLIVLLDSLEAATEIGSTLVSPGTSVWLSGPAADAVVTIGDVIEANGTAAKIQAVIAGLQATAAAIPNPSATDLKYVNAFLALAKDVLNSYLAATGQTVTTGWTPLDGVQFIRIQAHPHNAPFDNVPMSAALPKAGKVNLTKAERQKVEAIKKRAKARKTAK